MKIRVLGCHGSDQLLGKGAKAHQCGTCGFLVDGHLLIDAGTVSSKLSPEEIKQIRHIILSHLHFDHIKELPTLADNLVDDHLEPITVAGIGPVIEGLKTHVFNDVVYPDFFCLPQPDRPVLAAQVLNPEKEQTFSSLRVLPVMVDHTVPTTGFIVQDRQAALLYSGDTYQTDEIWRVAAAVPTLKAVLIETSYPNELSDLAKVSKHLTPKLLAAEFAKLNRPDLPLYVYHLKPRFRDRIVRQLKELGIPKLTVLEEGQEIQV